jgi:hypothetical protein
MKRYQIEISDRKRYRTVKADSAEDAVREAIGSRFMSMRLACWDMTGSTGEYAVMVSTGHQVDGATPIKNITAWAAMA